MEAHVGMCVYCNQFGRETHNRRIVRRVGFSRSKTLLDHHVYLHVVMKARGSLVIDSLSREDHVNAAP
jgi:hypothetical protein